MINRFLGGVFMMFFVIKLHAQVMVSDSVLTGSNNSDMIFYGMQCGEKTIASNTDWHFAVSVRPSLFPSNTLQGTTIRVNEALGVKVYQIPNFTADSFSVVVDTVGYHQWQQLHDSDSLIDLGALNTGLNINVFNYGWGVYNGPPNHDVAGNKVYLYELPGGEIGKFIVDQLDRDTAWDLKFSAIDNSDLKNVHIYKAAYSGKNFVYLNLQNANVHDKEPLSADWDLLFTKYAATDVFADSTFPVMGVLLNKGDSAAACFGVNQSVITPTAAFTSDMNTIGWKWKEFDYQNNVYVTDDSLVYFVKARNGQQYKMFFTAYSGSSTGIVNFEAERVCNISAVKNEERFDVKLYPNPANDEVYITADVAAGYSLYDLNGKLKTQSIVPQTNIRINTADFTPGLYLLKMNYTTGFAYLKFTVAH